MIITLGVFDARQAAMDVAATNKTTSNLEVVDALLQLYPGQIKFMNGHNGAIISEATARECRQRGLDIRPQGVNHGTGKS